MMMKSAGSEVYICILPNLMDDRLRIVGTGVSVQRIEHSKEGFLMSIPSITHPNTNKTLLPSRTTSPGFRATTLLFTAWPLIDVSPPNPLR